MTKGIERQPINHEQEPVRDRFNLIDNPEVLFTDLKTEIDKCNFGDRVWLRALDVQSGDLMDKLLPVLKQAADRSADVRIYFDPISLYRTQGMPSHIRHLPFPGRREFRQNYEETKGMLEELENIKGIQMIKTRQESVKRQIFPYVGADHIKGWVIGNKAYFGDKNLEDYTFYKMHGFVVKIDDQDIVEKIAEKISTVEPTGEDDQIFKIPGAGHNTRLILDVGRRNQSLIYDTAQEMIDDKENGFVGVAFQLFPEGKIFKSLNDAYERKVDIEAVTSRSEIFGYTPVYPVNRFAQIKAKRSGTDLSFAYAPPMGVHAKYLITEKGVLFGSHNLADSGVSAGTAELDLYSEDPDLKQQFIEYHNRLMNASLIDMASRRK